MRTDKERLIIIGAALENARQEALELSHFTLDKDIKRATLQAANDISRVQMPLNMARRVIDRRASDPNKGR